MTDHPLTETDAAEMWDEHHTPAEPLARTLLGVPEGHGAPHHDADQIRPGDFVLQVDWSGVVRAGIAHHQDDEGDWCTEAGAWITFATLRANRLDALTIWPAPTPPAEEVEVKIPTAPGAVITDVEGWHGDVCACMALSKAGYWRGIDQDVCLRDWRPHYLAAFTLPDGTRARRDGEHSDGTPRFVKVQEGEK